MRTCNLHGHQSERFHFGRVRIGRFCNKEQCLNHAIVHKLGRQLYWQRWVITRKSHIQLLAEQNDAIDSGHTQTETFGILWSSGIWKRLICKEESAIFWFLMCGNAEPNLYDKELGYRAIGIFDGRDKTTKN